MSRRPSTAPRPLTVGRRFRLLKVYRTAFLVLSSYGLFRAKKIFRGPGWAATEYPELHRRNARRVVRTILEIQGLFIKVGQLVSTLSSVLPADFRRELETLQDRIPPRPWAEVRGQLEAELGQSPEAAFAEVEREAIASASLAQVHRATLKNGDKVAIKVQHLDIERLARLDLATIRRILKIAGLFTGARGLGEIFDEVRSLIGEELDFRREADHIEEITSSFADDPMLGGPRVVRELSTPRVLVTSFVDGIKVTDLEGLEAQGIDRKELAERILGAYCRMVFVDGVFHADPHPGNILVAPGGRVVFVDFGAVGRVSPAMRTGLPRFAEGVLKRDREQILRSLKLMGFVQRGPGDEVAGRLIDYAYSRFLEGIELDSWNLGELRFDLETKLELMADLRRLDLLVRDLTTSFRVPREWILLARTLVLLLGVCTQLDPELRPFATARPFLEGSLLGDRSDWLRMARNVVQDLALTAVTLPGELERMLRKADRGEVAVEIRGLREGTALLYALGHQLLFAAFTLASGSLSYVARTRGDAGAAEAFGWCAGLSFLLLAGSWLRARKWLRGVRRGASRG